VSGYLPRAADPQMRWRERPEQKKSHHDTVML